MSNKNKLDSLFRLLDDSNLEVVQEAMKELLRHEDEITEYLARFQESSDPQLRRRVHQLQAIIAIRRRRAGFAELLDSPDLTLFDGLCAVHLQWYDNDSASFLLALWQRFRRESERFAPKNLSETAYFMRKSGFHTVAADELRPDSFCLGPVLDDRTGADFILCAVAAELARSWNCDLEIVRLMDNFLLADRDGKILSPANSWQILPGIDSHKYEFWSKRQIIELASSMLFSFAVSSNSFRYIYTIGHSLAKISGNDKLDFLPYPYGTARKEK
ncbi:MAG: transglutaminase family protein [Victivallales bacterium]|nr:transglutaminase family protein [Victivallales bacterium]